MSDIELGKKVFEAFWKWSRSFYGNAFPYSFEQFLAFYGKKTNIYLDGIGMGVRESGITNARIEIAMRTMAQASKGKVPENPLKMFDFLQNEATQINWVDAGAFVLIESGKTILKGAEAVGNSIITTGKIFTYLLPVIAIIFAWFWLNKKTDGQFSKAMKGFKK